MKKAFASITIHTLILGMCTMCLCAMCLCACGKKDPDVSGTDNATAPDTETTASTGPAGSAESAKPDVEVYLTADQPVPVLNKEVSGSYLPYDEEIHLNVFLPDGVEYKTEGGGFNNWISMFFTPGDGSWKAKITIGQEGCSPEWTNLENHPEQTSANKILIENAKYNGFDAKLFADEGPNWKYDNGMYMLLVDFGDKHVGRHTTLAFEATGSEGMDKPMDFLAIPELAAVLYKLSVEEGAAQNTWSQNGVTCTFPDNFKVTPYGDRGWTGNSVGKNGSTHVHIYTGRFGGQTPEEMALNINYDIKDCEWGGRKWVQAVRIPDSESTAPYSVSFFSDFSDNELLRCDLSITKASLDELLSYVEGDEFVSIMNAVDASSEARQAQMETEWDKNATNGDDFTLDGSWIRSYNGSETDIIIPEHIQGITVTGIHEGAFQGSNLTSVQIPDTVGTISKSAFKDCANLKDVRLSENLEYLGSFAFENTAIKEITIPRSVMDIGAAFGGCGQLETVNWLCSMDIPSMCFGNCISLKRFNAEGLVESVGFNAFNACTSLESISLPGVTSIGNGGFWYCEKLKEATFGELETLGEQAFYGCAFEKIDESLIGKTAELPDNVFSDCGYVAEIRIPAGVKKIGPRAFDDCGTSLAQNIDIYLPAGLESVADYGFSYCSVGNVYFDEAIKDMSDLPVWGEGTGPNFGNLMGNFVFGKDFYAANKDALAAYCDAIPGVGADRASDTPGEH